MASIQTPVFKQGLKTLISDMRNKTELSDDEYAERLGDLLEELVLSAKGQAGATFTGTSSVGVVSGTITSLIPLQ